MLLSSTSTPYLSHATANALLIINSLPRRRGPDPDHRRSPSMRTNRPPLPFEETANAEIQPFDVLELMVVQIGRRDRQSYLKPDGWPAILCETLFGFEQATRLADPRLEALRMLVIALGRRHPRPAAFKAALTAGITRKQIDFLVAWQRLPSWPSGDFPSSRFEASAYDGQTGRSAGHRT